MMFKKKTEKKKRNLFGPTLLLSLRLMDCHEIFLIKILVQENLSPKILITPNSFV